MIIIGKVNHKEPDKIDQQVRIDKINQVKSNSDNTRKLKNIFKQKEILSSNQNKKHQRLKAIKRNENYYVKQRDIIECVAKATGFYLQMFNYINKIKFDFTVELKKLSLNLQWKFQTYTQLMDINTLIIILIN